MRSIDNYIIQFVRFKYCWNKLSWSYIHIHSLSLSLPYNKILRSFSSFEKFTSIDRLIQLESLLNCLVDELAKLSWYIAESARPLVQNLLQNSKETRDFQEWDELSNVILSNRCGKRKKATDIAAYQSKVFSNEDQSQIKGRQIIISISVYGF